MESDEWRVESDDTVPGKQKRENIETLGDTLTKMMAEALDDITRSRS